jgi:hypothetical protein
VVGGLCHHWVYGQQVVEVEVRDVGSRAPSAVQQLANYLVAVGVVGRSPHPAATVWWYSASWGVHLRALDLVVIQKWNLVASKEPSS